VTASNGRFFSLGESCVISESYCFEKSGCNKPNASFMSRCRGIELYFREELERTSHRSESPGNLPRTRDCEFGYQRKMSHNRLTAFEEDHCFLAPCSKNMLLQFSPATISVQISANAPQHRIHIILVVFQLTMEYKSN
jgi:hypothetical protein